MEKKSYEKLLENDEQISINTEGEDKEFFNINEYKEAEYHVTPPPMISVQINS